MLMLFYSYTCSFSFLFKIKKFFQEKERERDLWLEELFRTGQLGRQSAWGEEFPSFFFFLFDFYTRLHTFRRRRFIILNQNFVPQNGRKNKQTKENKSKSTMSTPLKEGRPASRERIVSDVSISLKLFLLVKEEDERRRRKRKTVAVCSNRLCTANGQLNRIAPRENLTDEDEEERNLCRFFHRHTRTWSSLYYQRWLRCYLSCVSLDRNKKGEFIASLLQLRDIKRKKGNRLLLYNFHWASSRCESFPTNEDKGEMHFSIYDETTHVART